MRTFVAIEIPPNLKQRLRTEQQRLQDRLASHNLPPALRWTNTHNLHLTLRFLGETEDSQRRQMQIRLTEIAAEHEAFTLTLSRIGCFTSWEKLRVLWVGISGETVALEALQAEIESLARQVGFAPDRKRFSPHITLARSARGAPRRALRVAAEQLRRATEKEQTAQPIFNWTVRELCYIRSVLGKGSSQYTTLARFSLAPHSLPFH